MGGHHIRRRADPPLNGNTDLKSGCLPLRLRMTESCATQGRMYRCQLCNRVSRPGETMTKVVVERRPAEYPSRAKAQHARVGRKLKHSDDPGGAGYEIAKESVACPECAADFEAKEQAQAEFA